jgi:hypothetical protein
MQVVGLLSRFVVQWQLWGWYLKCSRDLVLIGMSTKPVETFARETADIGAGREPMLSAERRGRRRLGVRWRVSLWGGPLTETIETVTENLSSQGFYCLSKTPFVPGERLACRLHIPGHASEQNGSEAELECRVLVVRLDPANRDGCFGMGCRIEEYRVAQHRFRNG